MSRSKKLILAIKTICYDFIYHLMAVKKKPEVRLSLSLILLMLISLALVIIGASLYSSKITTNTKAKVPISYLLNASFEETIEDGDATNDPKDWRVIEGYAIRGTGDVPKEDERSELVQVVSKENEIAPYDGEKMLKVTNKRELKAAVMQYYFPLVTVNEFEQSLAVYPVSDQYLQQLEVRGKPDFPDVYGQQFYSLKFSHDNIEVCVRTGGPDSEHICGYDKFLSPLPKNQWSLVKTKLVKTESTEDKTSQWKLTISINNEIVFESGQGEYPYVQYIKSILYVFFGDECEGGEKQECDGPDGLVYYDYAFAQGVRTENQPTESVSKTDRSKEDLGLVVSAKEGSKPNIVVAKWSDAPINDPDFLGFSVDIRRASDDALVSIRSERDVEKNTGKVFQKVKLKDGEYFVRLIARYKNNVFKVEKRSFSYINGEIVPPD